MCPTMNIESSVNFQVAHQISISVVAQNNTL